MEFYNIILNWYFKNKRDLPWRKTKNPYKIWVSEIILQQTQISKGLNYYTKLISKFPTIKDLAISNEESVLKIWQGLGYYSRARNLHYTAQYIHNHLNDVFPKDYNNLIKLKGVGSYTAAAISSICFNEKRAVIDGNVYRVLARFFGISEATNSPAGIKIFKELANSLIQDDNPGDYNEGLMDLGATICIQKKPKCNCCPLKVKCIAYKNKKIQYLPFKIKKIKIKHRHIHYFYIECRGKFLMKKRTQKDIWKNLYDFPMVELNETIKLNNIHYKKKLLSITGIKEVNIKKIRYYEHKLTHQKLYITINYIKTNQIFNSDVFIIVNKQQALNFPLPKPVELFFKELSNSLDCEL